MAREFPPDYALVAEDVPPSIQRDVPIITGEQLHHLNLTACQHHHAKAFDMAWLTDILSAYPNAEGGSIAVAYPVIMWMKMGEGECGHQIVRCGVQMETGSEVLDIHATVFLALERVNLQR
jgi:hypothetical protein